jgi:hypothetical protein
MRSLSKVAGLATTLWALVIFLCLGESAVSETFYGTFKTTSRVPLVLVSILLQVFGIVGFLYLNASNFQ